MSTARAAVLLVGFGGPQNRDEIRPFLDRVLSGRPVPRERYEEVVRHYEAIGGRSPYNDHSRRQAAALRESLKRRGYDWPIFVAFRNALPTIEAIMRDLAHHEIDRVFVFILSAFRCEASWDRYKREIGAACAQVGFDLSRISFPPTWHLHRGFIDAASECIADTIDTLPRTSCEHPEVIFTAHSIPLAMDADSGYANQVRGSAALVARSGEIPSWRVAFQSRSGSPHEAWLEPDINVAITANHRPKIVAPLGFLCDHVEVLYDLDIQAAAIAQKAGIPFARAATVGSNPKFIAMVEELAINALMNRSGPPD
jgi:ferrochelatase